MNRWKRRENERVGVCDATEQINYEMIHLFFCLCDPREIEVAGPNGDFFLLRRFEGAAPLMHCTEEGACVVPIVSTRACCDCVPGIHGQLVHCAFAFRMRGV